MWYGLGAAEAPEGGVGRKVCLADVPDALHARDVVPGPSQVSTNIPLVSPLDMLGASRIHIWHGGDGVRRIRVKQRAVHNRLRQVQAIAGVVVQRDPKRRQLALRITARLVPTPANKFL